MREVPSPAEFPFKGYQLYGPTLDRKENRYKVFLVRHYSKDRTTLTLARYRMCVHLRRVLKRQEEVDHIDEDKLNDNLENLQILTRSNNVRKSNSKGVTFLELKCPGCGKIFHKEKYQSHLSKRGIFTSCSRRCRGKISTAIQFGKTGELKFPISENVVREYKIHTT